MGMNLDRWWKLAELDEERQLQREPSLELWRWSFAYLPDARMKAVAAGWMMRVLLGGDPAEISDEEVETLAVGALLATEKHGPTASVWTWDA